MIGSPSIIPPTIAPYVAAACQPATETVFDQGGRFLPDRLAANVDLYSRMVQTAVRDRGARLVVFPQFGLSGHVPGLTIEDWIAASLTFPGPQTERLARTAKETGAHIVFHATEVHPAFPGRYFASGALITPDEGLVLVHRKSYALTTKTRPIDVLDQFNAVLPDGLFPVVDTKIGRIGVCIAGEINWPEAARSLALKGAEIIVNPTASPRGHDYMDRPGGAAVRPARAFENCVYLLMANVPGPVGAAAAAAPSEIFDYKGGLIGQASPGAGNAAFATLDIDALRRHRSTPQANFLTQLQPAIHHDPQGEALLWPVNSFVDQPVRALKELTDIERAVWARLVASGRGHDPS